jgi:hypothetical protein
VGSTDESRKRRLKDLDLSTEDVEPAIENSIDRRVYSGTLREITSARIGLRDLVRDLF